MADFLKGQMDYIYFFYGLAFIILAAVCSILMKRKGQRLPWGLLGLFGLIHGLHEWMDLAAVSFGDHVLLRALRILLMAASFTILAEFGRAGLVRVRGSGPGRSVYLPLFALAAMGATAGLSGLATALRLVFGLGGGLWAAWALFLESRHLTASARSRLAAGSIVVAFYAVLAGLVGAPAAFFTARVFNTDVFMATFGFPVQLIRGILAVIAASCIWAYSQVPDEAPSGVRRTSETRTILPVAILLAIILAGGMLTQLAGNHGAREQQREGRSSASILADHLSVTLENARQMARERADSPAIAAALKSGSPRDIRQDAATLDLCKYHADKPSTSCSLLDAGGEVVVSCEAGRSSVIPSRTAAPRHEVLSGTVGGYYAFDNAAREWSYYAYAPVRDERGSLIGITVVKENLSQLEESFRKRPYTFLIDPNGIVFLSSNKDLCLRSLWPRGNETAGRLSESGQFGAGSFTPLLAEAAVDGKFITLEGQRLLVTRLPVGNEGWSLVLLNSTDHIRAYRLFVIFTVFVFCLSTIVFLAVLNATQESAARIAASEKMLQKLNEELEQRVELRTAELLKANERLRQENDARKAAEKNLRLFSEAVEEAQDGFQLVDLNGQVLYSNKAVERLYGFSREELLGRHVNDMNADAEFAATVILPAIRQQGHWNGELLVKHKDGRIFPIWLTTSIVKDEQGTPIAMVGIIRDITERRRTEERLAQKTIELERSNAELEHFASVVSHDLKAPLVSIGGFARAVLRNYGDTLDARARKYLEHIFDGTIRMERLIGGLMAYARVGSGGKDFAPVDCNRVLAAALSNLRAAAGECHAVITSDHLPVVTGNETQLVQLFQNLIGNALKYRGEDPPRIHVAARQAADHAPFWIFSFADNGIGIDQKHFEKIFQIFQRVHRNEDTFSGMGIGLAVCKKIVEWHGGRIWVESEAGKGSTFFVVIP